LGSRLAAQAVRPVIRERIAFEILALSPAAPADMR